MSHICPILPQTNKIQLPTSLNFCSCNEHWIKIVPDAFTSVHSIISSFWTWLFSLGAVPKPPISRWAASSCICLLCPWRPCSAYLILDSPPHFAFSQHFSLLLLSSVPLHVNFTGSEIKAENLSGDKDKDKMKAKIKRVWNPLQSPYLDVCHHFVYVFYCNPVAPQLARVLHSASLFRLLK